MKKKNKKIMQQTNQIYKYFLCNKKSYKCLKVQIKIKISGEKNQNQRKSKLITSKKQKKKRKENQRK